MCSCDVCDTLPPGATVPTQLQSRACCVQVHMHATSMHSMTSHTIRRGLQVSQNTLHDKMHTQNRVRALCL